MEWNGVIIHINTPLPIKSTTGKKWGRFKESPGWIATMSKEGDWTDTAKNRQIAGLGVNVTEVYPYVRCLLKGFCNSIGCWRYNRDVDGWQLSDAMYSSLLLEIHDVSRTDAQADYPVKIRITSELLTRIGPLKFFLSP